jgi:translation elongation factor EF-Tu-like GTPase
MKQLSLFWLCIAFSLFAYAQQGSATPKSKTKPKPARPVNPPAAPPVNLADSSFYMPVEDVFPVPGKGVAVVGKISTGKVSVGQRINIMGFSGVALVATVSSIEKMGAPIFTALPGDYIGLLFQHGVNAADVKRGMVAIATNFGKLDVTAAVELTVFANAGLTIRDRTMLNLYYNGIDIPNVEAVLEPSQSIEPGQTLQLKLSFPVYVVMIPNLEFYIRNPPSFKALAKGKILMANEPEE